MQNALYLHIGTEKTGSTALQMVSGKNRDTLMKHGILYPRTPGEINQVKLTLYAAGGPKTLNLRRLAGLVRDDAYKKFKASFADELKSEILASGCTRIYLSNEHLSSRLTSAQQVDRVATISRPLADTVKIVVYLRPQPELYLSSFSTAIKAGRTRTLEPPRNAQNPRYDYASKLALWGDAFGDENVIVRIYDRNTLVGGDLVKDFFSIMGYEPGSDINIPTTLNARLDHAALQFLLEFNKYVPLFLKEGESVNPDRGNIIGALALATKSSGPSLPVPATVLQDIAKLYEESNALIARRFLGRSDGKLFADVEYGEHPKGEALTVERAVEISAHLWRWKQREFAKARSEIARLSSKSGSTKKSQ
jgi:hypothetical protein